MQSRIVWRSTDSSSLTCVSQNTNLISTSLNVGQQQVISDSYDDGRVVHRPYGDKAGAVRHKLLVQYGCGLSAPPSWLNFDASPSLVAQRIPIFGNWLRVMWNAPQFPREVRYGDIVKGLSLPAGSCSAIYCSHILEHLSLTDCRMALQNTWQYLDAEGIFRFVLPDLEHIATAYVQSHDSEAAHRLMRESLLGCEARPRGFAGLIRSWLGNSKHLWMWDYKSMAAELASIGFRH